MRRLDISNCSISDEGAESLARALAVNRSLQVLDISDNKIGDNGIAHIATALQTNNSLTSLVFDKGATTDEGALSLAAALATNRSMEYLMLYWSSTHPDSALRKIGECVRTSMLYRLDLVMNMPSGEAPVPKERAKEWLQRMEVGGKELVQSLKDFRYYSNLRHLRLLLDYQTELYMKSQYKKILYQSIRALRATATAVNKTREHKRLPYVDIWMLGDKKVWW